MLTNRGSYLSCISFLIRLNKPRGKTLFSKLLAEQLLLFKKNKICSWGTQFLSSICINFEQNTFHMHLFIYSRMVHIIHGLQKSELISSRMEAASVIALFKCFIWIYLKFQLHSFSSCFVFALGTVEATIFSSLQNCP